MKLKVILLFSIFLSCFMANAQMNQPDLLFPDDLMNHNMGITSDGVYYYTINGGNKDDGVIKKYDFNGTFIASYPIPLDMRSIMYHPKNLEEGAFEVLFKELYENPQSSPALSGNGKSLYVLDKGELSIYKFATGELVKTVKGFFCGPDLISGATAVAADKKNIYTWNRNIMLVYKYDTKANLISKYHVGQGDYGFSLSYANGMIFISKDGNSRGGAWYGYKF